jgi:hypothetical protein
MRLKTLKSLIVIDHRLHKGPNHVLGYSLRASEKSGTQQVLSQYLLKG